jgi:diaminopimelate decarboxylase
MMYIEGLSAEDITEKYGTPVYVLIEGELRERMRRVQRAFPYPKLRIQYAGKNNSNLAIVKMAQEEGLEFDASSVGEIILGLMADFDPKQITYTNLYKTEEDIAFAAEIGVQAITADSIEELDRMARVGQKLKTKIKTFIRVNPLITLGKKYSTRKHQYGIPYPSAKKAIDFAIKNKHIDLVGLHFHGGYVNNPKVYLIAANKLLKLMRYALDNGCRIKYIDLGGGFPTDIAESEAAFIPEDMGDHFVKQFNKMLTEYDLPNPVLIFEPGKFITRNSGLGLTKVRSVKQIGKDELVIVDGSTYCFVPDALIYNAKYNILPADKMNTPRTRKYKVYGCTCDNIDIISQKVALPKLEEDDILAVMDLGAYSNVMASNFNTLKRAPMVMVSENGTSKLIRRRDQYSDMFAPELDVLKMGQPGELRRYYELTRSSIKKLWEGNGKKVKGKKGYLR